MGSLSVYCTVRREEVLECGGYSSSGSKVNLWIQMFFFNSSNREKAYSSQNKIFYLDGASVTTINILIAGAIVYIDRRNLSKK